MSGDERLEKSLDDFDDSLQLNKNTAPEHKLDLLIKAADSAERLSSEDCYELALKFNSYSFFLKRVHNREFAKRNAYIGAINKIASKYWNDYGDVYGNEIKLNIIANEYPNLREYMDLRDKGQRYIDEIDGITMVIDKYVNILQNYGRKKEQ